MMRDSLGLAVGAAIVFGTALMFCVMAFMYFQFIDGEWILKPLVFESTVLSTTQDRYKPGEMVQARLRYSKNIDVIAQITWTLVSDRLIIYGPQELYLPREKSDVLVDIARIPNNISTDSAMHWKFIGIMKVPVNWMKSINYHIETTQFEIIGE